MWWLKEEGHEPAHSVDTRVAPLFIMTAITPLHDNKDNDQLYIGYLTMATAIAAGSNVRTSQSAHQDATSTARTFVVLNQRQLEQARGTSCGMSPPST